MFALWMKHKSKRNFQNMKFRLRDRKWALQSVWVPVTHFFTHTNIKRQPSQVMKQVACLPRTIPIELYSLSFSRTADALRPWEGRTFTYSLSTFRNDMFLLISSLALFSASWIFKDQTDRVNREMGESSTDSRRTSYDTKSAAKAWAPPYKCDRTRVVFFLRETWWQFDCSAIFRHVQHFLRSLKSQLSL